MHHHHTASLGPACTWPVCDHNRYRRARTRRRRRWLRVGNTLTVGRDEILGPDLSTVQPEKAMAGASGPSAGSERADTVQRFAPSIAFVLICALSAGVSYRARHWAWFAFDDWQLLAARTPGDLGALLEPHSDHWATIPILAYRALWDVFGLRFEPYLLAAIGLRLISAVLLRVVMRRSGVTPWIATSLAGLYAALAIGGSGSANLFALSFGGWPIVFGLGHLLLADHDGPIDRRDAFGLLAGLGAIASAPLGVSMVVAVGVSTAMRRGLKVAALHTVPLAVVFVGWYVSFAPPAIPLSVTRALSYVPRALWGTASEVGRSVPGAVLLIGTLMAGAVLAWKQIRAEERRSRLSVPCGLLAATLAHLGAIGLGRDVMGGFAADSSRLPWYIDPVALMVFPTLAVAATALARARPRIGWLWSLVFLAMIPVNLRALDEYPQSLTGRESEQLMLSLPRAPLATGVPRSLTPEPILAAPVSMGWLIDALQAGRAPAPSAPPAAPLAAVIDLRLSLSQTDGMLDTASCTQGAQLEIELERGEHVSVERGRVMVSALHEEGWTPPVVYGQPFEWWFEPREGQTLTALRGPLTLRIAPAGRRATVCTAEST